MAVQIFDLGTNSDSTGSATVTIVATIPDGAFLYVHAFEKTNDVTIGGISDSSGNNYTPVGAKAPGNNIGFGRSDGFYVGNMAGINGGVIIYTKSDPANYAVISAFWATGVAQLDNPLDTAAIRSAAGTGTSVNPIKATNASIIPGNLFVGVVAWNTDSGDSFIPDNRFHFPPTALLSSASVAGLAGGYYQPPSWVGTDAITFSPHLGHSLAWACFNTPFITVQKRKKPVVTELGSVSNTAAATVTITGVNIPAGSLIYISSVEQSNSVTASVTDTAGNTYINFDSGGITPLGTDGQCATFYAFNSKALVGGTITYTKAVSAHATIISGLWATNIIITDPVDQANGPSASAGGPSTNPSADYPQSNPTQLITAGELLISSVFWGAGVGDTFTQDNTSGPWSAPSGAVDGTNGIGLATGWMINPEASTNPADILHYSATLNNSRGWRVTAAAFQPQVGESPPTNPVDFMSVSNS